jgi:hypothetical protein
MESLQKNVYNLVSSTKYYTHVELVSPILEFVDFLIYPSKYEDLSEKYTGFITTNLHLLIKDSKFPVFSHLQNVCDYVKHNVHVLPDHSITLKSCLENIIKNDFKDDSYLVTDLLCNCDQFCGVYCFYLKDHFKHNTVLIKNRLINLLKFVQHYELINLTTYVINIIKDIAHMMLHGTMTTSQYKEIMKDLTVPEWMKDLILCNLSSIPYYELKYMFGIPYCFSYDAKNEINTDFDRFCCNHVNNSNYIVFPNLTSCITCVNIEIKSDEKGSVEEEKEKSRKMSQLSKILILNPPITSINCDVIKSEFKFDISNSGDLKSDQIPTYYDKRDIVMAKISKNNNLKNYISNTISNITDKSKLMKEQYLEIMKCKFINEEDTLYNSIYDWDPEFLIFENDGKDNLHVFSPAEYEQLVERNMNFYNRQPLDPINKYNISNRIKIFTYSKYPRIPILNNLKTYLDDENVDVSILKSWIFNTYNDLHVRLTLYYLSNTKFDYGVKFSNDNISSATNLLFRMLFNGDE